MISSPTWWIGVVFVGIILNILSAYLKPCIDKYLGQLSNKWKKRIELQQQRIIETQEELKDRPHEQLIFLIVSNRFFNMAVSVVSVGLNIVFFSCVIFLMKPHLRIEVIVMSLIGVFFMKFQQNTPLCKRGVSLFLDF